MALISKQILEWATWKLQSTASFNLFWLFVKKLERKRKIQDEGMDQKRMDFIIEQMASKPRALSWRMKDKWQASQELVWEIFW